jgi:hypothetical protein
MHAIQPLKYTALEGNVIHSGLPRGRGSAASVPGIIFVSPAVWQRFGNRRDDQSADAFEATINSTSTAITMTDAGDEAEETQSSPFLGSILEPGSSFDPTFLFVVDGVFLSLFIVLVTFAILTRGNIHLIFLTFIELALWVSVKWYVKSVSDSPWQIQHK